MIRVTYPNEGIYIDGKPRWEVVDAKGQITSYREATPEEARDFALADALTGLQFQVEVLVQRLQDLATYGISMTARK